MKLRRVFAIVPDCHVAEWRYSGVWQRHFYDGLKQSGVKVVLPRDIDFGWARPPQLADSLRTTQARSRVSEMLLAQILAADGGRPQAVISYCFSHDLDLDLVDRVRAAGIPWINFYCDSLYAFDWVSALAARTSLNWFVESVAEARYRALGVPYLCAPYALNPAALPDASLVTPEHSLLFVGSANRQRLRTAALLRLAGADLQVRGWGWTQMLNPRSGAPVVRTSLVKRTARASARLLLGSRTGDFLDFESLLGELRQTAVVLGLNEYGEGQDARSYLKLRDLEFPGMGCCCLTQYHSDLESVFEIGKEILTFGTAREAARTAKDLSRHPAKCREIGRLARVRVLAEHTWSARLPLLESRL